MAINSALKDARIEIMLWYEDPEETQEDAGVRPAYHSITPIRWSGPQGEVLSIEGMKLKIGSGPAYFGVARAADEIRHLDLFVEYSPLLQGAVLAGRLDVYPCDSATAKFLQGNPVPLAITKEDLDAVWDDDVVKVFYLPHPTPGNESPSPVEVVDSTDGETDGDKYAVEKARQSGEILVVLRLGKDFKTLGSPAPDANSVIAPRPASSSPESASQDTGPSPVPEAAIQRSLTGEQITGPRGALIECVLLRVRGEKQGTVENRFVRGICASQDGLVVIPVARKSLVENEPIKVLSPWRGTACIESSDDGHGLTLLKLKLDVPNQHAFSWVKCRTELPTQGQQLSVIRDRKQTQQVTISETGRSYLAGIEGQDGFLVESLNGARIGAPNGSPIMSINDEMQGILLQATRWGQTSAGKENWDDEWSRVKPHDRCISQRWPFSHDALDAGSGSARQFAGSEAGPPRVVRCLLRPGGVVCATIRRRR